MTTLKAPPRKRDVQLAPGRLTQAGPDAGVDGAPTTIGCYGVAYGQLNDAGRVFVHGAFSESISEINQGADAKPLPIGWLHEIPIGKWSTLRDDQDGPYLEGTLSQTSTGEDAAVLARDGLTAVSVGFIPLIYQFAEPGEMCSFDTPYGRRSYQFDEYALYVVKADLEECSLVLVGADDDARITLVQTLLEKADRAMPGLTPAAGWEDVAYSMALLMGGRGASSFQDLPDIEHQALYQRLGAAYTKFSKTPPAYSRRPQYRDVAFQHDERLIFQDRYLRKQLAAVIAGAAGIDGQLSAETREEVERALQALTDLTNRRTPADTLAQMQEQLLRATTTLNGDGTSA